MPIGLGAENKLAATSLNTKPKQIQWNNRTKVWAKDESGAVPAGLTFNGFFGLQLVVHRAI